MDTIDDLLPDTGGVEPDLPRPQGSQSQQLLITLVADYSMQHPEWWPSAGLVALLGDFGITPAAARAALSRLGRRGVLESRQTGRQTSYRLSDEAVTVLATGGRRIARFAGEAQSWTGEWTVVLFAGAGDGAAPRRLRARLRWLGFAPLYDGVWVSPYADPAVTASSLGTPAPAALTVIRGRAMALPETTRDPLDAWDLTFVEEQYRDFLDRWGGPHPAGAGEISGQQALVARTRMIDHYRRFPALDPQLPQASMPPDWPRAAAREVFERSYDGLGAQAEARVRHVLTSAGAAVPDGLRHHTVAQLAAGFAHPR